MIKILGSGSNSSEWDRVVASPHITRVNIVFRIKMIESLPSTQLQAYESTASVANSNAFNPLEINWAIAFIKYRRLA